ncbi:MAG: fatty acyl-AMP ligase [Cyanobacteria bacterium P01_G01_bin.38]
MMNRFLDSSFGVASQCSTFVDLLELRAHEQPDSLAYTFLNHGETEDSRLSYRALSERVKAIAARLQSIQATGERALLLYPPGLDFVAAFLGCLYAGVIAVPAYPPRKNQNLSRLQTIVADSQASVLLTTDAYLNKINQWLAQESQFSDLHWLATDTIDVAHPPDWQKLDIKSDQLAFLQYTSGSTGEPKGVMVTQGNLMHNSAAIHWCFGHDAGSRGVIWLPPYHDMGLIGGVLQPLYGGFSVVLMSPVDFLQKPMRWLQAISRYGATTSGGPNFAYDLCVRRLKPEQLTDLDLSSWQVAFTGAEPVRAETLDQFSQTFEPFGFRREAFYPCYGMAETTLIVSGGDHRIAPVLKKIETEPLERHQVVDCQPQSRDGVQTVTGCGQSLPDQIVAIVNPDTLLPCSPAQVGEVWVAGPSIAQGYWHKPQETQAAFGHRLPDTGNIPFLRTGDLGFLDNDELFITGRIKDIIIIRGQNYYPQDIELTVENSHPALRLNSGAVFSVADKGQERLVVVHEVERTHLRKLDVPTVTGNIRQAVAANHNLQTYATILVKPGSIPKTSSGKIRRRACKAAFLTGGLKVVEDWSENPRRKAEFLNLQAEVTSVLEKLSAGK